MAARLFTILMTLCLLLTVPAQALSLDNEGRNLGSNDLPSVDQAIQVSAQADWQQHQVLVRFDLLDHIYLYKKRLGFALLDSQGKTIRALPVPELSGGVVKDDPLFGRVTVFYNELDVALPIQLLPDGASQLQIDYQGCIEDTLCYPPQRRIVTLPPPTVSADPGTAPPAPQAAAASQDRGFMTTLFSEDASSFRSWIQDRGLGLIVGLFFLGGILLAFTPCVFPMVPILSGIIAGEKTPSARRGFTLSVAYVLGMAIPYTLAGLLVALFGAGLNLQFLLQRPAAIITSAVIFVLLALSMFGLYELQLPEALRSRLGTTSPRGGRLGSAAGLGAISALVVSPCVTPILAGALIYVASSGDATTGALSLFALALGMGVPLIIVGTGGGHFLPRAGQWMDEIKRFFGVVMLAVAIWLLGRIISPTLVLALYGLLLAAYGIQLGALERSGPGRPRFRRAMALLIGVYGMIMLIGATAGGDNPWQPLAPFGATPTTTLAATGNGDRQDIRPGHWRTLHGKEALDTALSQSAQAGRPVLVDFFAEWCVACKELEKHTLNDSRVLAAMRGFDLYRVDITDITPTNRSLMRHYDIFGLPCLVFFDASGNQIDGARVLGNMGPERFLRHLDRKVTPETAS